MQENVEINISDTEEDFNRGFSNLFPEGLKGQIKQAGIFIVCIAGPGNPGEPTFPVGTE